MIRLSDTMASFLAWAGLLAGVAVWAANTQWGQIAPYLDCQTRSSWAELASLCGVAIVAAMSFVSWQMSRWQTAPHDDPPKTWRMIALVSAASGVIFAFALAMQGLAALVIDACAR
ncbi:MAG TPA: hypothetical protein DEA80_10280 [Afipia sp.]|nr:hypothetical protein [Afipia sp.]OUX62692.1 MAG: hypothetical protein CBB64_02980 [Afipia sp. TMED4]HAO41763.1 hypothetical protein [Afipia sp.]HAP13308.1 hypothetical protein [Afipia sp.]HAQ92599.1 hypothetical protein [Afipia sp.]